MNQPDRIDVFGSNISIANADQARSLLCHRLELGEGGYVCFSNVHTVVTGRSNRELRAATNGSLLSLADGMPVYWVARRRAAVGHVPGPDFMWTVLQCCRDRRHFFYGSTPEVLDSLRARLLERVPGLKISGMLSPPFRELSAEEQLDHYRAIRESRSEFVWVGLGAPKQEVWMAKAWEQLRPAILLGVGAAFDFHAGMVRRAPRPVRAAGLEWLYRLGRQPRRLWRRYLVTNSLFLTWVVRDSIRDLMGR